MQSNQKNVQKLEAQIQQSIVAAGGALPFDDFMALALYAPGVGYYTGGLPKIGMGTLNAAGQTDGSDFVTAPQLSPLFGQCVAGQVLALLVQTGSLDVWEFGAGTGALAKQVLTHINAHHGTQQGSEPSPQVTYHIVDLSGHLQSMQRQTLAGFVDQVQWHNQLPDAMTGVVLGNELLDAMPVKLLQRKDGIWHERCVNWQTMQGEQGDVSNHFDWVDRPTTLRPPVEVEGEHDYLTEIHPQAEGWVTTIAATLLAGLEVTGQGGAMLLIDYGFPEVEYYHPQRHMGTLMCHQAHQADTNPLADVGQKDITAHVNFTSVALAAQDAGLDVLGYTSQGRFLINAGLVSHLDNASLPVRANALKLVNEHEMGELFEVICIATKGINAPSGFDVGDRTHRL